MLKPFLTKWPFLWKLRLFLGLILLALILVFFYFKIIPLGHITYSRSWPANWHSGQGFIGDFKPDNRLDRNDPQSPKIIIDPVYFSVFTPRTFDSAIITIKYRDQFNSTTPLIEIGVLKDQLTGSYDLQPLQNNLLDHWRFNWPRLEDSDSRLILQTKKNYYSVSEFFSDLQTGFLKDCPSGPLACVAVYNYPLKLNYSLPDYVPLRPLVVNQPLRGAHQFYLYLKNEPWRLNFDFLYLRQDPKSDPATVNIWSGDKIIMTQTISDNSELNTGKTENKSLNFSGPAQAAGVYKIEVKISNDVVIKRIESSSDKLSVIHKIWPVSGSGDLTLFTDAKQLRAQTSNPASLGKIIFGGQTFDLNKTYQPFNYISGGLNQIINLKKDDLVLENNGVFAFAADSLLNPGVKSVDRYFLPGDNIKYIIADYSQPVENDGLKTASAKFNLISADRVDGRYTFLISIPGLTDKTAAPGYLEIKEITIDLKGRTLWQKIWD